MAHGQALATQLREHLQKEGLSIVEQIAACGALIMWYLIMGEIVKKVINEEGEIH
jgi:hypothetical protein